MRAANSLNSRIGLGMLRLPRWTSDRSWVRKRHCGITSNEAPLAQQPWLNDRRQVANAGAGKEHGRQPGKIVHRQVGMECQRFLVLAVDMHEGPAWNGLHG
jgi:hypothetical protein